jgi:YidC/Oxa1 family membrane protein insertase
MMHYLRLSLLSSFFCVLSIGATQYQNPPNSFSVSVNNSQVVFTQSGDLHSIISNSYGPNADISFFGVPFLELRVSGNSHIDSCVRSVAGHFSQFQTDSTIQVDYISDPFLPNVFYEKHFIINKKNHLIDLSCKISGDTADVLAKQCFSRLIVHPLNSTEDPLKYVVIDKRSKKVTTSGSVKSDTLSVHSWIGMRTRFSAILLSSNGGVATPAHYKENTLVIDSDLSKSKLINLKMYCGPVQYSALQSAGNECTRLLYPLWFWMRWLSIGLMLLFDSLLRIMGNVVIAIVALSICVKIIIAPLFKIADKWQKKVNAENALLQPRLIEIKSKYKGEEQNKQTFALYKELGINPLYSLKSLLSAAIQIPVFFAAYHMLSEHIALNGVSFLWIDDLSFPDHAIKLPFTLPYFGKYVNILPFFMTSITFAASWIHTDHSLSVALRKKQRSNLYMMAGLFFVLLYTSPSGMVIYWTMNNLLAFFSTLIEQKFPKKKHPSEPGDTEQKTNIKIQEPIGASPGSN